MQQQLSSRKMEAGGDGGRGGMNSLLSSLEDLHHPNPPNGHLHESQTNQNSQHHHQDDFLEQMLSTINPNCGGWPSHNGNGNGSHDLSPSNPNPNPKSCDSPPKEDPEGSFHYPHDEMNAGKSFLLHHQLQLLSHDSSLLPSLPLSLATAADSHSDVFKSPTPQAAADNYNGFAGSLHGNQQHFHHPPQAQAQAQAQAQGGAALAGQDYGGQVAVNVMNQPPAPSASTGGSSGAAPQRQRVRARRGQATDPHSIAERLRRERIAERMKALQELVPNGNKTDKASMLDEIIDYVKFLQLQVKVLSMSRLGGAGAIAPLVADMSSEGGGGRVERSSTKTKESMRMTEHQVAKLMEEDMGSAMQYLQGKGLCLMPISLATAISTATCNPSRLNMNMNMGNGTTDQGRGPGPGPSSPNMSVQSATLQDHPSANSVKDTDTITTNPPS